MVPNKLLIYLINNTTFFEKPKINIESHKVNENRKLKRQQAK